MEGGTRYLWKMPSPTITKNINKQKLTEKRIQKCVFNSYVGKHIECSVSKCGKYLVLKAGWMPTAGKFFYNYILLNTNKQVVGITNDRTLHIVTFYRIEISCATKYENKGKNGSWLCWNYSDFFFSTLSSFESINSNVWINGHKCHGLHTMQNSDRIGSVFVKIILYYCPCDDS